MELLIPEILTIHHFCQDILTQEIKNGGGEREKGRRGDDEIKAP